MARLWGKQAAWLTLFLCLALVGCGDATAGPVAASVATVSVATTIATLATHTPTLPATRTPPATIAPRPKNTPTVAATATPAEGAVITPSFRGLTDDVTLRYTRRPPHFTQQQIMHALSVQTGNGPYTSGQTVNGRTITIRAAYGLGTIGRVLDLSGMLPPDVTPDPACTNWAGPCGDIHLVRCVPGGGCSPTIQTLTRIENRPMWLIQLANMPFVGSLAPCVTTVTCPPMPQSGDSVMLVDDETGTLFAGSSESN